MIWARCVPILVEISSNVDLFDLKWVHFVSTWGKLRPNESNRDYLTSKDSKWVHFVTTWLKMSPNECIVTICFKMNSFCDYLTSKEAKKLLWNQVLHSYTSKINSLCINLGCLHVALLKLQFVTFKTKHRVIIDNRTHKQEQQQHHSYTSFFKRLGHLPTNKKLNL